MSINNSLKNGSYGITINVPEELIEELISKGGKPPLIFSNVIKRMSIDLKVEEILSYANGKASIIVDIDGKKDDKPVGKKISLMTRNWTYPLFEEYMGKLIKQSEKKASIADIISMLIAYFDTSSRPTSEELRGARGFGPGEKWFEELRTSKARLTIAAKHMLLPSFFHRAYGSGLNRRHPIDEDVYKYLLQWAQENEEIVAKFEKLATPRSANY